MDFQSLDLWWPETGDIMAEVAFQPIFSPLPTHYAEFPMEGADVENWWEGNGSINITDSPSVEVENVNSMGGGGGMVNEEEGLMEEGVTNHGGNAAQGCKNLLSERNRRKRLNQQLIALRSLVPDMSKMDKRSILMDAAAYIQNLHREIEEVKREIAEQEGCYDQSPASSVSNLTSPDMASLPHEEASSAHHHIFKIETDEMDDRTLSVKVVFGKARGAAVQVQRLIESVGTTVTHTWTHEMEGHQMITTSFISLKKQMNLTAEMLKEQMNTAALRMGFEIDLDD